MILPIGHEETSVRRLPWVSFALIASCLLVFLLTDTSSPEGADAASRIEEAAAYWREHAYLEAEPEIRELVAYDVMPNQRRQYLVTLATLAEPMRPREAEGLAAQQAELDRLTALALGRTRPAGEEQSDFERWGYVPAEPRAHGLLTYAFLHGGWLHLIGNLFLLLLAAPAIEDRWGRALFAGFYAMAAAFAALAHASLTEGTTLPLVGASGAIAGVLGAFLVRLWNTQIRFAYFFVVGLRPIYGTFEAAAWVMLPLWFGNELFQAFFWDSAGVAGGTAYWAHVGGFAFGVAAALGVRALRIEERFIDPAIEAQITHYAANPVLEEAMAARERGDLGRALELLQDEWRKQPDEDLALALWDAAVACEQPEVGAPALAGAVRDAARRGDLELAVRHWASLAEKSPSTPVDPATLMRLAPVLAAEGRRDLAALALRQTLDPANAALTGGQALRIVELARGIDPPSALRAARMALASPELHEAKRAKLEGLVAELEAQGAAAPPPEAKPEAAPAAPDPGLEDGRSIPLARFGAAKLREGRATGLDAESLRVVLEGGREGSVRLDRIQAVAAAIVDGLGPKPVLVIDLLVNWNEAEAEELRGLRLRSDRFDPRKLLGSQGDPRQAFAELTERLLAASGGVALPSQDAALGRPFARLASLADYEREVLSLAS